MSKDLHDNFFFKLFNDLEGLGGSGGAWEGIFLGALSTDFDLELVSTWQEGNDDKSVLEAVCFRKLPPLKDAILWLCGSKWGFHCLPSGNKKKCSAA